MSFEEKTAEVFEKTGTWLQSNVLQTGTLIELSVILFAFFLGFLARRASRPFLLDLIQRTSLTFRLKHSLNNITKLILHVVTVILIGVVAQLAEFQMVPLRSTWIGAVSKLLFAWIFIKILSQFITNNFLRNVVSLGAWVVASLSILGVLGDAAQALDGIGFTVGEFRLSLLSILSSILSVFIFVSIAMFVSNIIERRLQKTRDVSPAARVLITKILKFSLIFMAILVGITSAGIDLSVLAVFGGALGLGIGFGLQKGVSNLFSGILLLLDRSIKPGDIIELQESGTFGWVEHMGARYTNIVTRDNKSYLVPNEDLVTQQVVNWSHGNTLVRLEVKFGVHYDSDPHKVREIATEAAKEPERVVEEPSPICHITEFGDSSVNFTLRFWIKDAQGGVTNVKGQVFLALWDAFKKHKIQIPYPHREVYVHDAKK